MTKVKTMKMQEQLKGTFTDAEVGDNTVVYRDTRPIEGSQAWLDLRRNKGGEPTVTGTESAVCSYEKNVSPYISYQELVDYKRGNDVTIERQFDQGLLDAGHELEEPIMRTFCRNEGFRYVPCHAMYQSKEYHWVRVNPDGLCRLPSGELVLLEAKSTPNENRQTIQAYRDKVGLITHITQVRQCMIAMPNINKAIIVLGAYARDLATNRPYLTEINYLVVERDKDIEAEMLKNQKEFIELVKSGKPAPLDKDFEKAEQLHDFVVRKFGLNTNPAPIQFGSAFKTKAMEIAGVMEDVERIKAELKERENALKAMCAEVEIALGEHELGVVELDNGKLARFIFKPRVTKRFSADWIKQKYPHLYEANRKPSVSRTLKVEII